jgi:hypothetical protein
MELEGLPSSANGRSHKNALNPEVNKCPNEHQFDEQKIAMKILDMHLRAGYLNWYKGSEARLGRTRGILIIFKCSPINFKY